MSLSLSRPQVFGAFERLATLTASTTTVQTVLNLYACLSKLREIHRSFVMATRYAPFYMNIFRSDFSNPATCLTV